MWGVLPLAVLLVAPLSGQAQTVPPAAILMHPDVVKNATAARWERQLYVSPTGLTAENFAEPGQVRLPRFAASLSSVRWLGQPPADGLKPPADGLKPPADGLNLTIEPDHWIVAWTQRPADATVIVLTFDTPPKLLSEVGPVKPVGDGSLFLPASLATTTGEKIRFEPQTFKNTVGYWTGKKDSAEWQFAAARSGIYNVAILQGCGAGQGGSRGKLTVTAADDPASLSSLEFDVSETGHFQNFQWRHLGTLNISNRGVHRLKIEPIAIKHAALVDIRAVQLIPVPQ